MPLSGMCVTRIPPPALIDVDPNIETSVLGLEPKKYYYPLFGKLQIFPQRTVVYYSNFDLAENLRINNILNYRIFLIGLIIAVE